MIKSRFASPFLLDEIKSSEQSPEGHVLPADAARPEFLVRLSVEAAARGRARVAHRALSQGLADLFDLLQHGAPEDIIVAEAGRLLRVVEQHEGVVLGRDALGADIGGDAQPQGEDPCLQGSEPNVGVEHGLPVGALERDVFAHMAMLTRVVAAVAMRPGGGQP